MFIAPFESGAIGHDLFRAMQNEDVSRPHLPRPARRLCGRALSTPGEICERLPTTFARGPIFSVPPPALACGGGRHQRG